MNKLKFSFTGLLAFLLSAALHAVLIGGIMYASGMTQTGRIADKTLKNKISARGYELLPDVEVISDISTLKHSAEEKKQSEKKDDFGTAKAQPAAGGADDKSVFMYQDAVKRRIQAARFYPDEARQAGTQGAVEVSFVIMPDGTLGNVSLIKSSGREVLDEEAVSTIKRASPYPAYDKSINKREIDMQVAIVFKLN